MREFFFAQHGEMIINDTLRGHPRSFAEQCQRKIALGKKMFCEFCGRTLQAKDAICPDCGAKAGSALCSGRYGQAGGTEDCAIRASWTAWITPLRNMTAMKQLVMCCAVAIFAVSLLCVIIAGEMAYFRVGGILTAIFIPLILVGLLVHLLLFGGKELYVITDGGVWRGPAKGARDGRVLSGALTAAAPLQLLGGNLGMAGASMMAAARVQETMAWRDVKEVSYRPGARLIVLKEGVMTKIWMFCTKENYAEIAAMVKGYTGM